MALGMTCDEFWNCHPSRYKYYQKAHELRNDQRNQEMWLQGLYVYSAISTALHNQPAFATKPPKQIPYLEKPIPIRAEEIEERKKQEEEMARQKLIDYLNSFQENWERKHERNGRQGANRNNGEKPIGKESD